MDRASPLKMKHTATPSKAEWDNEDHGTSSQKRIEPNEPLMEGSPVAASSKESLAHQDIYLAL